MRTRSLPTRRARSIRVIRGPGLVGVALLIMAAPLRAGISPAGGTAASPDPVDGSWPSSTMCEPWPTFQEEAEPEAVAPDPKAEALVVRLSHPAFSAVVDFESINVRMGGVFVDGQPLDVDVPSMSMRVMGRAVVGGGDWLAYLSLADGLWAHAELARGSEHHVHRAYLGAPWERIDGAEARPSRLPAVLRQVSGARLAEDHPDGPGDWYDVRTSTAAQPGTMWDTTVQAFPILRDAGASLRVAASDDGLPLVACLAQYWWQGVKEDLGESALLLSTIRFTHVGEPSRVPPSEPTLEQRRVRQLGLRIGLPEAWQSSIDDESGDFWMLSPDAGGLPSIRVTRGEADPVMLRAIKDASEDEVLDALARYEALEAEEAWGRDPASIEPTILGGRGRGRPIAGRVIVNHPDFADIGPHTAVDVVVWVSPYRYLFQLVTPVPDEVPSRYLLDRILETVRFDTPS